MECKLKDQQHESLEGLPAPTLPGATASADNLCLIEMGVFFIHFLGQTQIISMAP